MFGDQSLRRLLADSRRCAGHQRRLCGCVCHGVVLRVRDIRELVKTTRSVVLSKFDIATRIVNMLFMGTREDRIIEAAIRVFSRYGVKRTTMNDIAGEAGIVRQTLYNAYANKEELLRATIRWFADQTLAAIEADGARAATLGETLDIVFEHVAVRPFDLLDATPHAEDIIGGFNEAARDELATAGERTRMAIEDLLAPYETRIRVS